LRSGCAAVSLVFCDVCRFTLHAGLPRFGYYAFYLRSTHAFFIYTIFPWVWLPLRVLRLPRTLHRYTATLDVVYTVCALRSFYVTARFSRRSGLSATPRFAHVFCAVARSSPFTHVHYAFRVGRITLRHVYSPHTFGCCLPRRIWFVHCALHVHYVYHYFAALYVCGSTAAHPHFRIHTPGSGWFHCTKPRSHCLTAYVHTAHRARATAHRVYTTQISVLSLPLNVFLLRSSHSANTLLTHTTHHTTGLRCTCHPPRYTSATVGYTSHTFTVLAVPDLTWTHTRIYLPISFPVPAHTLTTPCAYCRTHCILHRADTIRGYRFTAHTTSVAHTVHAHTGRTTRYTLSHYLHPLRFYSHRFACRASWVRAHTAHTLGRDSTHYTTPLPFGSIHTFYHTRWTCFTTCTHVSHRTFLVCVLHPHAAGLLAVLAQFSGRARHSLYSFDRSRCVIRTS